MRSYNKLQDPAAENPGLSHVFFSHAIVQTCSDSPVKNRQDLRLIIHNAHRVCRKTCISKHQAGCRNKTRNVK